MMVSLGTTHAFVKLKQIKAAVSTGGIRFRNFIIKPLIWLQVCPNEIKNTSRSSNSLAHHLMRRISVVSNSRIEYKSEIFNLVKELD